MMYRKLSVLIAAGMLISLAGCGGSIAIDQNSGSVLGGEITPDEEAVYTQPEVPEGAIVDYSGDFVYSGKLQQIGDDENGYIQVPLGYLPFQDVDVSGLTQYCDTSGTNIVTLDYYEDISYRMAAESMLAYAQDEGLMQDIQGATVKVGEYDALQLYGHYDDGFFLVAWFIEDPANTSNSYYLAIEFDNDHSYLMACSSTFQTVEDYHAASGE